ncbi:MAG: hypothetical protein M3144_03250, partial [Actinomycetota bacterium]|nr:hypothetical protein [Actinomycetota bacterium]
DGLGYRYLSDAPGDQLMVCPQITFAFGPGADDSARQRFTREGVEHQDIGVILEGAEHGTVALGWLMPTGVRLVGRAAAQFQNSEPLLREV